MSSPITVASLTYIRPQDLAPLLSSPSSSSKVAVIDVRDNDYLGGHIRSSIHTPINQLDARLPELLRTLQDKDKVVFHCMLSQQRGPHAALKYARAKAVQAAREGQDAEVEKVTDGNDNSDVREGEEELLIRKIGGQEICVLEGGFQGWQARYGTDKTLTEGYVKELWESVFS